MRINGAFLQKEKSQDDSTKIYTCPLNVMTLLRINNDTILHVTYPWSEKDVRPRSLNEPTECECKLTFTGPQNKYLHKRSRNT